jgi:Outer membrane protein beta-barrel domain
VRALLAATALVVFGIPVAAKDRDPSVEAGGGYGYARALHSDLDFGAPTFSATARVRVGGLIAFEPQVGYWWHEERETFHTGGGETIETRLRHAFTSVTGSLLVVSPSSWRVGVYGGGGIGVYYGSRRYEVSGSSEFPPSTSSRPYSPSLGGQLLGGADVRAASRLRVFGEFRFELQSVDDPGSSAYRVLGGVRVPIL